MNDDLTVHDSSGNIFEDTGTPDAGERLAKAEVARSIRKMIRERGLTRAEAARLLDLTEAEGSDVLRGNVSRFSLDRLAEVESLGQLENLYLVETRLKGRRAIGARRERPR